MSTATPAPRAVIDLVDGVRSITIPCPAGGVPAVVPVSDRITYGQIRTLLAKHGWSVTDWHLVSGNRERLDAELTPAASAA